MEPHLKHRKPSYLYLIIQLSWFYKSHCHTFLFVCWLLIKAYYTKTCIFQIWVDAFEVLIMVWLTNVSTFSCVSVKKMHVSDKNERQGLKCIYKQDVSNWLRCVLPLYFVSFSSNRKPKVSRKKLISWRTCALVSKLKGDLKRKDKTSSERHCRVDKNDNQSTSNQKTSNNNSVDENFLA